METFEVGDAVVHPRLGAGVVTGFEEVKTGEEPKRYYNIKILRKTPTNLLVPVDEADGLVRHALTSTRLEEIWEVLGDDPEKLPKNHRTRHKFLREKLATGDPMKVAESLRDLAWRRTTRDRGLTTRGKRLYRKSLQLLAGEVAVIKDVELATARRQITKRLKKFIAAHVSE
ncbi:MAG: CarD family transcriptional regulator [Anaerolineae bacterium]